MALRLEQQLVLRAEVVLHEPDGDARLGCDLAERRRREAALHGEPHDRVGDLSLAELVIHSLRHEGYGTDVP